MKTTINPLAAALAVTALALVPVTRAEQEITTAARAIYTNHQDAVVWVSAVAKVTMSMRLANGQSRSQPEREQRIDAVGTVLDPGGVVVLPLSQLDLADTMNGREVDTPQGRVQVSASARINEVKVTLADGTEIPADIVLRDADLDVACVRMKLDSKEAKGAVIRAVDVKHAAPAAVLDEVVVLGRMGDAFNRRPAVVTDLITSEIRKPRAYYYINCPWVGVPVFAANGRLVGLCVNRFTQGMNATRVVLPAEDIAPLVAQALTAKPVVENPPAPPAAATPDPAKDAGDRDVKRTTEPAVTK